jgi:type II secretory pathway pseudopilin PulG
MHFHGPTGQTARRVSEGVLIIYPTRHHRCRLCSGVTLIETIIVLAIIAGMLALLLPAVQRAREAARDGVCQNNLHQIAAAAYHFRSARMSVPEPAKPDRVGGWTVSLLPFLEENKLAEQLANNPDVPSVVSIVKYRPRILTCPVAWEGDSGVATVPAAHYSMTFDRKLKMFYVNDVPVSCRLPWAISPEMLVPRRGEGPHDGGYYIQRNDGDAYYSEGQ